MQIVPFNIPPFLGSEESALKQVLSNQKLCGDGIFNQKCKQLLKEQTRAKGVFLTPSCTSALEMALILANIAPQDEVIMPSFTFTSTATAVTLLKGVPVFIDIRPDTLNINEDLIEQAISPKTKAIIVVHYAGVSCNMDKINTIAQKHNLLVIEDAAQGINASYKGQPLATLGDMGAYSFHETKNITCGEGGALLVKSEPHSFRGEIIAEKGTNRQQFFKGMVDKYSWQDYGSSYLISEFQAAYLYDQLLHIKEITDKRLSIWNHYFESLKSFADAGKIQLPHIPSECQHNAHLFYIILPSEEIATHVQQQLKQQGITAAPHYVPLHTSKAGKTLGKTPFPLTISEDIPKRLLRLPLFYNMEDAQVKHTVKSLSKILNNL